MSTSTGARKLMTDDFTPRTMVGIALAHAWRDPMYWPDRSAVSGEALCKLRHAWGAIAAGCTDLKLADLSLGELTPQRASIEPLIEWFQAPQSERAAAFDQVFGMVTSKDCPPYETDYCHWEDPTYRASQMADVAGFYRAFGVEPGGERPERPDHVSIELEFVALLYRKSLVALAAGDSENADVCCMAREAFVRDHVGWWMPTFARCMQRRIERQKRLGQTTPGTGLQNCLNGIGDLLRAWAAVMRTDADLPASREIIAPNPPVYRPEEEDDACASCGPCQGDAPPCTEPVTVSPKGI